MLESGVALERLPPQSKTLPRFSSSEHSTGITVRLTMNEAAMLVIVAMAMGVNKRPSMPSRPSSGRNTRMISTVA